MIDAGELRRTQPGTEGASLPANLSGTRTASIGPLWKVIRVHSARSADGESRVRTRRNSQAHDRGGVLQAPTGVCPSSRTAELMTETPAPPRTSPLHDRHEALGASFTDFGGWNMPVRYTSDLAEHHAVREAAGLFDISHMAEFVVTGPRAAAFLDYVLAGRLSTMKVGKAKYSLVLAASGGIVDAVNVYCTGRLRCYNPQGR